MKTPTQVKYEATTKKGDKFFIAIPVDLNGIHALAYARANYGAQVKSIVKAVQ